MRTRVLLEGLMRGLVQPCLTRDNQAALEVRGFEHWGGGYVFRHCILGLDAARVKCWHDCLGPAQGEFARSTAAWHAVRRRNRIRPSPQQRR